MTARPLRRGLAMLALAASAVGLSACGPEYDRTEITVVSSSYPSDYSASLGRITVTEGTALTLHLVVYNDDNEKMPVRFVLTDNQIANFVAQVDPGNYTLLAYKEGVSQLQIIADDTKVLTINVYVRPQPTPP